MLSTLSIHLPRIKNKKQRHCMFYLLTVKEIRRETPESVSVFLEVPSVSKAFFDFKPGQYLTFRHMLNGQELRRSYSLSSMPGESLLRVGIREVANGAFSVWANRMLKKGDVLETMVPQGNFTTDFDAARSRTLVFAAAGSGITPILSLIKSVRRHEPNTRILLLYGNRTPDTAMYGAEIAALVAEADDKMVVKYFYSRHAGGDFPQQRLSGTSCGAVAAKISDFYRADAYFICGPEAMIFSVRDHLLAQGVDGGKIKYELFTTPLANAKNPTDNDINAEVTVVLDDEEFHFPLNGNGDSILDAAIAAGADAPFSCKGAVCCTCKAKVVEGSVAMDMNYALDDREVEEGYILTCQSHPTSARVVIDYDVI
jgi:ring-1,2-phenylacetyl-CoA epoxidase subunit PaaE